MKNLTAAIFLTCIFCVFSVSGKDTGKGGGQNSSSDSETSSLMSGAKKMYGEVKNFLGFDKPAKTGRSSGKKQNSSSRRVSRRLNNQSFRDTLWEERLKDWEKRHSQVPQSLPRATFTLHKQSSSRSFRSSHRSFRSSHSHHVRHVRHHRSSRGRRRR